nr:hypothetical protein [Tanacetum cinerariifolium]
MAKKDTDLYHSRLTLDDLNDLIIKYKIPRDLHPRLPSKDFVMSELSDDAIGIYHRMFDFFGVRIPFSSFLMALIKHYRVYFSQLSPLGLNKVITFEVLCRSLQMEPTVTLFKVFQTLCKQAIDDPKPVDSSFNMADVHRLSVHVIKLRDMPEGVLVLSRLSRVWKSRISDPVLRGANENGMGRKASTSGATSSHVDKRTRSVLAQSSGITTRPSLFVGDDDESDDDDNACVEIPLVTTLRSTDVIPSSWNQGGSFVAPAAEGSNTRGMFLVILFIQTSSFFPLVFIMPHITRTVLLGTFPTPSEMVRVESLSDDQLSTKMSVLHCMMMSHGGELLARYRRLNQSHHEYVLSTDSRLKGYEEKVAKMTGLGLQVSALKKQVSRLNDKLSSSDASFEKSKIKGKEMKKKIKSLTKSLDNLHTQVACLSAAFNQTTILKAERFLASDEFSRVQGELLSLAASAGFEHGLIMHRKKDEFAVVLKKMVNFMPGVHDRLAEASPLIAQTDYAFLNKISKHAAEPLLVILQLKPEKLVHPANVLTPRDARVSPPIAKESTVTPASKSLELSANVASEHNEEMVSAEVDGSDPHMTDDTITAKSGHAFVQGMSVILDDVVELAGVGLGHVSSGLMML